VDSRGNVFIADSHNNRIRKVSPDGIIRTIAGSGPNGTPGDFAGDGGPAVNAHLNGPRAVAVDSGDNVYVADYGNNTIRILTPPRKLQNPSARSRPRPAGGWRWPRRRDGPQSKDARRHEARMFVFGLRPH
jgi:DNA-binding beta-propeller fold protein YncE